MNCKTSLKHIDDYLENTADQKLAAEIADHLAACPVCREQYEAEKKLISGISQLPGTIQPRGDLWIRIDRQINKQPAGSQAGSRPGNKLVFAFSAAVFVVGILFGITILNPYLLNRPAADMETAGSVYLEEFAGAAKGYNQARQKLLQSLNIIKSKMNNNTVAIIETNIRIIDSAITDIKTAIHDNPGKQQNIVKLAELYRNETLSFLQTDNLLTSISQ